ncbi:MAG: HlyD family secretion protein [Tannerella sp.]|jgi:HlyD family secretion protein|nr:HlyD family secretion protein [Tannerella sp.]
MENNEQKKPSSQDTSPLSCGEGQGERFNIELRSGEVQEILARPPHSLIRYGISIISGVVMLLIAGSFIFKYPDIIRGEAVVTTENPPVWLMAKASGRIKELYCIDKQHVRENEILAVIDNPAETADMNGVESLLNQVLINDSVFAVPQDLFSRFYELGNVQTAFSNFTRAAINYDNFLTVNLTDQEKLALQKQISGKRRYSENLGEQIALKENELRLGEESLARDRNLYEKGVISRQDMDIAEQTFLNLQQSYNQLKSSMISENLESVQMTESVKKLGLQYLQEKNQYVSELKSALKELNAAISSWEQTFLLASSIDGTVTFNKVWQKDQFVESGTKVFAVVPENQGALTGKIVIASAGIGKVKENQSVNIKLSGYPYMEYGVVKAKIKTVSLIPEENNYTVEAFLTNGLQTNTGKTVPFTGELSGEAEIITDNRSLGARLIAPLRYLWEEKINY